LFQNAPLFLFGACFGIRLRIGCRYAQGEIRILAERIPATSFGLPQRDPLSRQRAEEICVAQREISPEERFNFSLARWLSISKNQSYRELGFLNTPLAAHKASARDSQHQIP
jgi:hypothetical protein